MEFWKGEFHQVAANDIQPIILPDPGFCPLSFRALRSESSSRAEDPFSDLNEITPADGAFELSRSIRTNLTSGDVRSWGTPPPLWLSSARMQVHLHPKAEPISTIKPKKSHTRK
jgi:hypothetical protein